jgi:hypothetical protein
MSTELKYPLEKFKPLVIESYRNKDYNGTTYKRRLRINRFNALMIDEILGTHLGHSETRFVVLDTDDIIKACQVLGVEYKPVNTYFDIDYAMCAFREVPSLIN